MDAIILAAGMGSRLGSLTRDKAKCLVEVGGMPIIDRVLRQLKWLGVERLTLVVGYQAEGLMDHVLQCAERPAGIEFVRNDIFAETNNMYSLWLAKDALCRTDVLLLESDLLLPDSVVRGLADAPCANACLVAPYEPQMNGTVVQADGQGIITRFIPRQFLRPEEAPTYLKTVNAYKLSRSFAQQCAERMEEYLATVGRKDFYEVVFGQMVADGQAQMLAVNVKEAKWHEVDTPEDLAAAEQMRL